MNKFILLPLLWCFSLSSTAEIVVIGHIDNDFSSLTKKQVQELFMGRTRSLPNGVRAVALDVEGLRNDFYRQLTQRPIEQIDAYWARLTFTGRFSPPEIKTDQQAVITAVAKTKGAIAYVDDEYLEEGKVKKLLILSNNAMPSYDEY